MSGFLFPRPRAAQQMGPWFNGPQDVTLLFNRAFANPDGSEARWLRSEACAMVAFARAHGRNVYGKGPMADFVNEAEVREWAQKLNLAYVPPGEAPKARAERPTEADVIMARALRTLTLLNFRVRRPAVFV